MKRVVSLLMVLLSVSMVSAQEGDAKQQSQERRIPATLAEAHAELERILSAQELARIDAMPSEEYMMDCFRLGQTIRHDWGLWQGGPLARHMEALGVESPLDMSEVILETFWCRRHGQDLRLEERGALYDGPRTDERKIEVKERKRIAAGEAAMRDRMMGLRCETREVPLVWIPVKKGISDARFLCPFRGGVFFSCYLPGSRQPWIYPAGYSDDPPHGEVRRTERDEEGYTVGCFLDPTDRKIHRIGLPELDQTYATVVADGRAWFAGLKNGEIVLVGIGDQDRIMVPLPQTGEFPDLGLDGQALMAVYSKAIYRLTDRQWTRIHSGGILLPRSALPQRHGDTVFFRDEAEWSPGHKHLWWLTIGEELYLSLLEQDMGVLRYASGSYRPNVISYGVTSQGDLWTCAGSNVRDSFLFRRSTDGRYSIAVRDGSVRAEEAPLLWGQAKWYVHVSSVKVLPDDTLLLAGNTGLYRLKGDELIQELAFAPMGRDGKAGRRHDGWQPNDILALDDRSYVISSRRNGSYWIRQGDDGRWSAQVIEKGDPVVW